MPHITISGHRVGRHQVADMFWIVATSQCAKAPNRVLRDHRAQANHEHCQSVTSSAAPDVGSFLDIWLRMGTKEFGGPHKIKPSTECRLGGEPSKSMNRKCKHHLAKERWGEAAERSN
jgi:hypothetical protein